MIELPAKPDEVLPLRRVFVPNLPDDRRTGPAVAGDPVVEVVPCHLFIDGPTADEQPERIEEVEHFVQPFRFVRLVREKPCRCIAAGAPHAAAVEIVLQLLEGVHGQREACVYALFARSADLVPSFGDLIAGGDGGQSPSVQQAPGHPHDAPAWTQCWRSTQTRVGGTG